MMGNLLRKQFITQTFNSVASGYDNPSLRFFKQSAEKLPHICSFSGNERVLDAATGTGLAALELANALPEGKIIAVDMSEGMLAQAKKKAAAKQIENIDFLLMDIEDLTFPDDTFDHINCSFGIFFMEDMQGVLNHLVEKLKPGGSVVTCCFAENAFQPHANLFFERIQTYGVEIPVEAGFKRLADEQKSTALYEAAQLTKIKTYRHDLSFVQKSAEEWWDIIWYAGFRGFVDQLEADALVEFKQQHLAEISELTHEHGIDFNLEVIFTVGEKQ